jgi:hypothetical protein
LRNENLAILINLPILLTLSKLEEVKEGGQYLGVPVIITEKVADNCVFVNANQSTGGRA